MIQKKPITEAQALKRLGDLCAKTEHCSGEIIEKMYKMGLPEDAKTRIMEKLTKYSYVDDERFTNAYVYDKIRYNKWGRRKIEQALWAKRIDNKIANLVLDAVPDEEYLSVLRPLLKSKYPTIKAETDYERSVKLIKYALGKGFTFDLIKQCIDAAVDEDDI
ncbi:regulatory protein RecX [Prevotella bivia]|uniref:regulatory protein RecX n=1 Tax=Prevotella bivia TaxID=28125 RepID=UPI00254A4D05|nr:regulatory protein RecX [Prevotella bivia]MDK7762624.1 regulatory protein RecX [Prevotella bivia]MDU3908620.1 regulatory protein RecX [Prevotella bivia]MDZ3817066.1 regulatory protein RecX [Prevotella bivia]